VLLFLTVGDVLSYSRLAQIGIGIGGGRSRPCSASALKSVSGAASWAGISAIGGCVGVPVVTRATRKDGGWYDKIELPKWTPPRRLFAPVWTTLYSLMGVSSYRVWSRAPNSPFLPLFAFHYVVNLSWSFMFFMAQNLRLAHSLNFVLLSSLVVVMRGFFFVDKMACSLLLPYLAWLFFATILNDTICRLNPSDKFGYNNAKFVKGLMKLQLEAKERVGL